MRLINADELPVVDSIDRIDGEQVQIESWVPAKAIQEAPTVEAIPMEWIAQWLLKNCYNEKGHYIGEGYDTVEDMLEDWRKEENEGRKHNC